MSNKTSDKNVANIEELIQEYRTYNDLDGIQDLSIYVNALENILAEREQKDKRIQELEEEKNKTQIMSPYYVKKNYIPKQVVRDKIEELKNNLKYIDCNSDCSKCFNEEGKALYRGSKFVFCFAYHQIKILQELLEGEK